MNLKASQSDEEDPTPEIRPFHPTDTTALDHIFRITADTALRISPDPRTLLYGSYIWCHPYPFLSPSHCFVVALPSSGNAVGYILSTPSTTSFSKHYTSSYLPTLSPSIQQPLPPDTDTAWRPDNLPNALLSKIQHADDWPAQIEREVPGVLERYPAHLHIDVLPEWQGQGWGTRLMEACLRRLKAEGVRGVHLQMVEGNVAARKFYLAVGFRMWAAEGSGMGEWCMVKDL